MSDDMKANLAELMKEAQKMQKKMQEAQTELANTVVVGESGGGLVKIEMTGRHDAKKATISKSLLDEDDVEMIEDLVVAAINDAVRKIEKTSREKIGKLTAGMNLPTGFDTGDE